MSEIEPIVHAMALFCCCLLYKILVRRWIIEIIRHPFTKVESRWFDGIHYKFNLLVGHSGMNGDSDPAWLESHVSGKNTRPYPMRRCLVNIQQVMPICAGTR